MYDLYLVTDSKACLERPLVDIVMQAVDGGVTMVQLREKELDTRQFINIAKHLKKILAPLNVPLIINDRVDIALVIEADGVHIGQNDMPYILVKKIIPKHLIVGLSIETLEQAKDAEELDVDYLGVSPVFSTPTKTNFNKAPWGLEGLKQLKKISKHKLIAIGGINKDNIACVLQAGADGIAVVSAICSAPYPRDAAKELMSIIKQTKSHL